MENWRKIGVKLEYLMETCGKIAENSIFHFEQSVRMGVQTMLKYSQQFSTIFPQSGALTGLHRLIGILYDLHKSTPLIDTVLAARDRPNVLLAAGLLLSLLQQRFPRFQPSTLTS